MATWTDIPDANLEPGAPARSVDALALRDNCIVAGQDVSGATSTYNSGSGTYSKPAGYDPNDTVLVRVWGGGGAGSTGGAHFGGGGGGFNQRAFRYSDFPASASYTVGAGGATVGDDGGDSYVTGTGVDVAATGGISSGVAGVGGVPGFRYGGGTTAGFSLSVYGGGQGDNVTGNAVWGGGGGNYGPTTYGSLSIHGGAGAYYDGATGYDAQAPGGGGVDGRGPSMVAGAAGRVQFIVIRGWHSTVMSNGE